MIYLQRRATPAPIHGSGFWEGSMRGMSVELANLALDLDVPVRERDRIWMNER